MPGLFYVISMKSCNIQSRCSASVSPDAQVTRINVPSAISCIFLLYGQAPVPRLSNTTDVLQPQHITGIQSQADRVTSTPWQMEPSSAPGAEVTATLTPPQSSGKYLGATSHGADLLSLETQFILLGVYLLKSFTRRVKK